MAQSQKESQLQEMRHVMAYKTKGLFLIDIVAEAPMRSNL